jgi:glycogen(starch) synthase
LNIAYISYEYPPDTSGGGIGTYTEQVATILASKGHKVSVFSGTTSDSYSKNLNGVFVYRIQAKNAEEFRIRVVNIFNSINKERSFDIIESPDYGADGYHIKLTNPELPYVIKLHTPTYIIKEYNNYYLQYILPKQFLTQLKIKFWRRKKTDISINDIEFLNVQMADRVFSPSYELAQRIVKDWHIPFSRISIIPNPYQPNVMQLSIPLEYNHNRITFIGKLSILKGALDFITIIPIVLKKYPNMKFRFIGEDSYSPDDNLTMKGFILERLKKYKKNIEFTGKVELVEIEKYLSETDFLICNSLWENYPTVILEAMSAGRVVIGTKVGGIPEIIRHGKNALIVKSKSGRKIANEILKCYGDRRKMKILGGNARSFIMHVSSNDKLFNQIISNYKQLLK